MTGIEELDAILGWLSSVAGDQWALGYFVLAVASGLQLGVRCAINPNLSCFGDEKPFEFGPACLAGMVIPPIAWAYQICYALWGDPQSPKVASEVIQDEPIAEPVPALAERRVIVSPGKAGEADRFLAAYDMALGDAPVRWTVNPGEAATFETYDAARGVVARLVINPQCIAFPLSVWLLTSAEHEFAKRVKARLDAEAEQADLAQPVKAFVITEGSHCYFDGANWSTARVAALECVTREAAEAIMRLNCIGPRARVECVDSVQERPAEKQADAHGPVDDGWPLSRRILQGTSEKQWEAIQDDGSARCHLAKVKVSDDAQFVVMRTDSDRMRYMRSPGEGVSSLIGDAQRFRSSEEAGAAMLAACMPADYRVCTVARAKELDAKAAVAKQPAPAETPAETFIVSFARGAAFRRCYLTDERKCLVRWQPEQSKAIQFPTAEAARQAACDSKCDMSCICIDRIEPPAKDLPPAAQHGKFIVTAPGGRPFYLTGECPLSFGAWTQSRSEATEFASLSLAQAAIELVTAQGSLVMGMKIKQVPSRVADAVAV